MVNTFGIDVFAGESRWNSKCKKKKKLGTLKTHITILPFLGISFLSNIFFLLVLFQMCGRTPRCENRSWTTFVHWRSSSAERSPLCSTTSTELSDVSSKPKKERKKKTDSFIFFFQEMVAKKREKAVCSFGYLYLLWIWKCLFPYLDVLTFSGNFFFLLTCLTGTQSNLELDGNLGIIPVITVSGKPHIQVWK